ncbi:uncharacterized [Tachysurus ichikawai]
MAMITHSHSHQSLEEPEEPPGKKRSPRHNRLFHRGTVGSLCERGPGVKASCAAYLPLFFLPSLKWGEGWYGWRANGHGIMRRFLGQDKGITFDDHCSLIQAESILWLLQSDRKEELPILLANVIEFLRQRLLKMLPYRPWVFVCGWHGAVDVSP